MECRDVCCYSADDWLHSYHYQQKTGQNPSFFFFSVLDYFLGDHQKQFRISGEMSSLLLMVEVMQPFISSITTYIHCAVSWRHKIYIHTPCCWFMLRSTYIHTYTASLVTCSLPPSSPSKIIFESEYS